MNIGFDLDKVFIDYPPFVPNRLIDRLYKKKSNGILLYRIPKKPEQFIRNLSHYPLFRPIIKKNLLFLQKAAAKKKRKDNYYLISSRFGFLKGKTEKLATKQDFNALFQGLYFNYENKQPHLFKNEVIRKLKIEKFVDDDLKLIEYLASKNPSIVFYWLNPDINRKLSANIIGITSLDKLFKN